MGNSIQDCYVINYVYDKAVATDMTINNSKQTIT